MSTSIIQFFSGFMLGIIIYLTYKHAIKMKKLAGRKTPTYRQFLFIANLEERYLNDDNYTRDDS